MEYDIEKEGGKEEKKEKWKGKKERRKQGYIASSPMSC